MKTLTANTAYGYQELRSVEQRNMMIALLVAVTIQMMAVGAYHISDKIIPDVPKTPFVREIPTIGYITPPLIPTVQNPNIGQIPGKYADGVPVPVPDCEVKPDMPEYKGQDVSSWQANNSWDQIGDLSGEVDIKIDDADPLPGVFVAAEVPPEIILRKIPEYPDIAKRTSLEGSVVVNVLIDKNGTVKKAQVIKSNNDIFNESALAAAYKWVFKPALMQGKPVAVWMAIPFRFSITKM
ncbi:MAG: energy transducer TonB [Bacteroidetes bacterium]|nr:energy transducer TonB [Bacteroidota bacterium]